MPVCNIVLRRGRQKRDIKLLSISRTFLSIVVCILVGFHVYKNNNTMQIKFMFIIENPDNALLNIQVAKSINNICGLMDYMANF